MSAPRGPEEHKAAARGLVVQEPGKRPRMASGADLLALSDEADPYYCGRDGDIAQAQWFATLWTDHGSRGAHLRHVHYRAFTAGAARLDGSRYANDTESWKALQRAASRARYLGLVDPEALADQRNDAPVIGASPGSSERDEPSAWLDGEPHWPGLASVGATLPSVSGQIPEPSSAIDWGRAWVTDDAVGLRANLGLTGLRLPRVVVAGYDYEPPDQPVLVEVWAEKSAVDDTMLPLSRELGVNYVSGAGYLSVTRIVELVRRAEGHGKPAHVLYVSDFDPAGENMPRQVARQVQFWRETLGIDAEVTLRPVALTAAQVAEYSLPEDFSKPGKGRVELDALIALHPGALDGIIRDAIAEWRDPRISSLIFQARLAAQVRARDQWQEATAGVREAVDRIRERAADVAARHRGRLAEVTGQADTAVESLRARIEQVVADASAALEPYRVMMDEVVADAEAALEPYSQQAGTIQREAHDEFAALRQELDAERERYDAIAEAFAPELPDRPEAQCTADRSGLLYDSRRDWLEQLNAYRQSKGLPPIEEADTDGHGTTWQAVYTSLTSGNGSDGVAGLTDAGRRALVVALTRDGMSQSQIARSTGIPRTTVGKYARAQ